MKNEKKRYKAFAFTGAAVCLVLVAVLFWLEYRYSNGILSLAHIWALMGVPADFLALIAFSVFLFLRKTKALLFVSLARIVLAAAELTVMFCIYKEFEAQYLLNLRFAVSADIAWILLALILILAVRQKRFVRYVWFAPALAVAVSLCFATVQFSRLPRGALEELPRPMVTLTVLVITAMVLRAVFLLFTGLFLSSAVPVKAVPEDAPAPDADEEIPGEDAAG